MPTPQNPLRFVHISDTHINPDTSYNKSYAQYTPLIGAEALVRAVNALPFIPDFILHTGDVAYDPEPAVYPTIAALLGQLKAPVHYLAGNHDHTRALQQILMRRDASAVSDELYYEFALKGVQIVCLDSNGDHDPEKPSGGVSREQLDWLDAICTSDDARPLLVAVHHNVLPVHIPWLDDWMRIENGEALHDVLRQAQDRLCGVFYGHIHQTMQTLRDGLLYVSAGSSWCSFIGYPTPENTRLIEDAITQPSFNIVTISDTTTNIRRHTFAVDA